MKFWLQRYFGCFILMVFTLVSLVRPVYGAEGVLAPQSFSQMYNLAAKGDVVSLKAAIRRGLNIDAVNENGDTALCVAVHNRNAKAYNTLRAAGAAPRPRCSWKISYWDNFVNSSAVKSGALWQKSNYSRPVYGISSDDSNMWLWLGGIALIGGGTALALSGGGGGGGSSDDSGGSTGGLTCEYGCKTYDSENKCIECKDKPAEGCEDDPCREGCFTNLTCGSGESCTQTNSCGGCEKCESAMTSGENFVISTETTLNNDRNLSQSGTDRTETWGGIFTRNQYLTNNGDITLNGGSGGVGIMSCSSSDLSSCLDGYVTAGGENITTSGNITINADKSIGIFTTVLGTLKESNGEYKLQENLNKLTVKDGTISMNGRDNTGIMVLGDAQVENSSAIILKGKADYSHIVSGQQKTNLWQGKYNNGIYYDTADIKYNSNVNLKQTFSNKGAITVDLTTDQLLTSELGNGEKEVISVSGISVNYAKPLTQHGSTYSFTNLGNIDVSFNVAESALNSAVEGEREYRAVGLKIAKNSNDSFSGTNHGDIKLSGNANLYGIVADHILNFSSFGDINVDMTQGSQYAVGIYNQNSSIGVDGNISVVKDENQEFYALVGGGEGHRFDIAKNVNIMGNIDSKGGKIYNSGNIISDMVVVDSSSGNGFFYNENGGTLKAGSSTILNLENQAGSIAQLGESLITNLNNSGTLSGIDDQYGNSILKMTGEAFNNNVDGVVTGTEVVLGKIDRVNYEKMSFDTFVNSGTINADYLTIRTKAFENSGTINTKNLTFESFSTSGDEIDLSRINLDSQPYSSGYLVSLSSAVKDAFKLGDISYEENRPQTSNDLLGVVVTDTFGYSPDGSNTSWVNGQESTLELGNISMKFNQNTAALEGFDPLLLGVKSERQMMNTTLNGTLSLAFSHNAHGVQILGENSQFTNNGDIAVSGKNTVIGILSSGAGSKILQNGEVRIENLSTQQEEGKTYGTYGLYLTNADLEIKDVGLVSVTSDLSGDSTYGIFLSGNSKGLNNGHIFVQSQEGAMGVRALQTTSEGFINLGTIETNSIGGIGMFAAGYIDGTSANNKYSNLINMSNIYMYSPQSMAMAANGSKSYVTNNGNLWLKNDSGVGMYAFNNGMATNNGTIDLGTAGINNIGMFGQDAVIDNGDDGVIKGKSADGQLIGIYLSGQSIGENGGTIELEANNSIGVFAEQTRDAYGNFGTIKLTGDDNIGMYADGFVDDGSNGANDRHIKLINSGTIEINGARAIGMYASGANSTIINNGTINVSSGGQETVTENGAVLGSTSQAFAISNGAAFVNNGLIESAAEINLDNWQDTSSRVIAGKNGVFKAAFLSGTIAAGADIAAGSNQDVYINSGSIQSENSKVNLVSNSAMFDAALSSQDGKSQDIIMTRKSFKDLMNDDKLAGYLENNYQQGNRVDLFDNLKASTDTKALSAAVNRQLGGEILPVLNYQNLQRVKYFNRTMADLVLSNQNIRDERVSVVSNNYYEKHKSVQGVKGYEDRIYGVSGIFDKSINPHWRYGLGLSLYQAETDFDGSDSRKDVIVQLYNPFRIDYPGFGALIMPYLGYSHGEYKRLDGDKKFEPDLDVYYYGLNNRIYLKMGAWGLNIEPTAELNLNGAYQDKIVENNGVTAKSRHDVSAESGLGGYIGKMFDFESRGNLNIRAGAMYYYELNNKAYDSINARMQGMNGSYRLESYDNSRSRGLISLRAEYDLKGWNLYGEIMRLLEHNDNMVYNAGLKYNF